MSASAGYLAVVQIGSTLATITGIKSAEIKINGETYDITAFSDGQWKKYIGGLADYTLTFSGNWDMTDAQQQVIQAAMITNPGTQIAWAIFPKGIGTGLPKYSGNAIGKAEDIKFDVGSEDTVQFDLQSTGALVYAIQ